MHNSPNYSLSLNISKQNSSSIIIGLSGVHDLILLIPNTAISDEVNSYEAPHYATFSTLLIFPVFQVPILFSLCPAQSV
jgi:hypothetical protein